MGLIFIIRSGRPWWADMGVENWILVLINFLLKRDPIIFYFTGGSMSVVKKRGTSIA
jgi:hypothetical protein